MRSLANIIPTFPGLLELAQLTISIGTKGSSAAGGIGTMYFDDIRLIR